MDTVYGIVTDLIIVAVVGSFMDLLLPSKEVKHPLKLILALYFIAILINPFVSLFTDTSLFQSFDFDYDYKDKFSDNEYDYSSIYALTEASLSEEISSYLTALYEENFFSVDVDFSETGIKGIDIKIQGDKRDITGEITEYIAGTYGVKKSLISVEWEEALNGD